MRGESERVLVATPLLEAARLSFSLCMSTMASDEPESTRALGFCSLSRATFHVSAQREVVI